MAKLLTLPGSEPENEGERLVIEYLTQNLPKTHTLIPNVEISAEGKPPYEYDLIVIAPHAIYVVEIKQWRGGIVGNEHTWVVAGRHQRPNPFYTTNNKARVLKSAIQNAQPALPQFWVQAVVTIADDQGELRISGQNSQWICRYTEVVDLLQNKSLINEADLRRVRGYIENGVKEVAQGRQVGSRQFGDYEVLETLERRDHVTEYLAKHTMLVSQERVRLRVFSYNPYLEANVLERRKEQIKREVEALQQIGGHPNLIALSGFYTDPNDPNLFFSVTEWSEQGTLRDLINEGSPISLDRKLEIAEGIVAGLVVVHSQDVIHRDLRPENVLIAIDGRPRIMNFDWARISIPGVGTVSPVEHDPDITRAYMAPELLNPINQPTQATDIYSLGCIIFELLVGTVLYDTPEDAMDQNTSGGGPAAFEALDIPDRLNELVRLMMKPDATQRPQFSEHVWEEIRAIRALPSGISQPPAPSPAPAPEVEPVEYQIDDIINNKYKVLKVLPPGGFGQVYKVYDEYWDKAFALKIFQQKGAGREQLKAEFLALRSINHPHIARVHDWGVLPSKRYYLVSEFIEGEQLKRYTTSAHKLSVREAVQVIAELLQALEAIHPDVDRINELTSKGELTEEEYEELRKLQGNGWLHRDIKPANLILSPNGLKLVDFNVSVRATDADQTFTGTPAYLLPEIGIMQWSPDFDIFATGIVLYELITGNHPYPNRQPSVQELPTDPNYYRDDLRPEFVDILLRAVSCDASIRYHSARQFLSDLMSLGMYLISIETTYELIPDIELDQWEYDATDYNPYVTRLLTLYSQAHRDNSGTRGLDDIARHTYVDTRLDRYLRPAVLDGQYRLVIITGNAGDGKTAFIKNLEQVVQETNGHIERPTPNSSYFTYNGFHFVTNYDGSQDEGDDRANDQVLREFFEPFSDQIL